MHVQGGASSSSIASLCLPPGQRVAWADLTPRLLQSHSATPATTPVPEQGDPTVAPFPGLAASPSHSASLGSSVRGLQPLLPRPLESQRKEVLGRVGAQK